MRTVNKGKTCPVEGCDRECVCHGMCHMHWQRFKRNGTTDLLSREQATANRLAGRKFYPKPIKPLPEAKTCNSCKVLKTADQFYVTKRGDRQYLYTNCKKCHHAITAANDKKARAKARAEREANAPEPVNGGICTVNGCDRPQQIMKHALCKLHYMRKYTGRDMEAPVQVNHRSKIEGTDDLRRCTICNLIKPTNLFYDRADGTPASHCKACSIALGKVRQSITRYQDFERAYEYANSYTGQLQEKSLKYIKEKENG